MEATWFLTIFSVILISVFFKLLSSRRSNLPPSPALRLPILGHLHLVKKPLHRWLHEISQNCGPIFSLKFGSRLVVVVASPSAVEECFTKNDVILSNRPKLLVGEHIGYDDSTMVGLPYGDDWRNLRRISAQEIFSPVRLNASLSIRQDEVKRLVKNLYGTCCRDGFSKVVLRPKLSELSFNVIMRMIAGKRFFGEDQEDEEAKKFRKLTNEMFENADTANPEDFLPFLRLIDYRGLEKKLVKLAEEMDAFYQSLIDEHRQGKRKNTMISHLLSLQESEPQYYTDQTIKGLILVMLTAGTDTSTVTMEWAMSALLNNPEVLAKARAEIDNRVGRGRLVDESDMSELPYLQCIISETFRLFPAAPLSVARESSEEITVGGYRIPRGTMLIVNAWAIHRDPTVWEDAASFKPERFESGEVDGCKLMPFGNGRRACPGAGLGRRVIGLTLGSLIQCFEWERISGEEVDLTEEKGLTMPKAKPLEAVCKARDVVHHLILS